MSYTRKCTGCSAQITWNDDKKQYEDSLHLGERHDHKKYEAAAASHVEASNEKFGDVEGKECYTCKANGFPNEIIFFNNDKKSPTGKVIPLERPDKVNGEFVTHTHREKGKAQASTNQPENAPVRNAPTPDKDVTPENVADLSPQEMAQTMAKFVNVAGDLMAKLSVLQPQVETIIGYILRTSVTPADQAK